MQGGGGGIEMVKVMEQDREVERQHALGGVWGGV